VHAAIAWSPEVLAQVSKSSAAAGVAANQTVDVKATDASVARRIDVIRMFPWITTGQDHQLPRRLSGAVAVLDHQRK
jgi:hypothetical protein